MGNAIATGAVDLVSLEAKSTGPTPKFATPLSGALSLNGVTVSLASDSAEHLAKTVNRFTPQTNVTASITGSTAGSSIPQKHLTLTSPEDMRVDGDFAMVAALGLVSGVTLISTGTAGPASTFG